MIYAVQIHVVLCSLSDIINMNIYCKLITTSSVFDKILSDNSTQVC